MTHCAGCRQFVILDWPVHYLPAALDSSVTRTQLFKLLLAQRDTHVSHPIAYVCPLRRCGAGQQLRQGAAAATANAASRSGCGGGEITIGATDARSGWPPLGNAHSGCACT